MDIWSRKIVGYEVYKSKIGELSSGLFSSKVVAEGCQGQNSGTAFLIMERPTVQQPTGRSSFETALHSIEATARGANAQVSNATLGLSLVTFSVLIFCVWQCIIRIAAQCYCNRYYIVG